MGHMENDHLKCGLCDFVTIDNSEAMLAEHKRIKHFICDLCEFKGTRKSFLDVHIQKEHVNIPDSNNPALEYDCEFCGFKVASARKNRHR